MISIRNSSLVSKAEGRKLAEATRLSTLLINDEFRIENSNKIPYYLQNMISFQPSSQLLGLTLDDQSSVEILASSAGNIYLGCRML